MREIFIENVYMDGLAIPENATVVDIGGYIWLMTVLQCIHQGEHACSAKFFLLKHIHIEFLKSTLLFLRFTLLAILWDDLLIYAVKTNTDLHLHKKMKETAHRSYFYPCCQSFASQSNYLSVIPTRFYSVYIIINLLK